MKKYSILLVAVVACVGVQSEVRAGGITLGDAGAFAVLGGSTVTNTGATRLVGDLGVSPGTSITGFPPGTVTGTINLDNAFAIQAQADALTAYNVMKGLDVTQTLTGQDLGGLTLTAGTYFFASSADLTGTLTLSGPGQFVFQIGSTLTTASNSSMVETNGASASNVYFQVGSSATLATDTNFIGTIIASASDTLKTGANVDGRVIALTGSVTLDTNQISVPEPSSIIMLASGLTALLALRRRGAKTVA